MFRGFPMSWMSSSLVCLRGGPRKKSVLALLNTQVLFQRSCILNILSILIFPRQDKLCMLPPEMVAEAVLSYCINKLDDVSSSQVLKSFLFYFVLKYVI